MEMKISQHYVESLNALSCLWLTRLTGNETKAMLFILSRTLRWSKTSEIIPKRHAMFGVPKTGTTGIGMTYKTWLKCIRTLRAEGLIQSEITQYGTGVEVIIQRLVHGPLRA